MKFFAGRVSLENRATFFLLAASLAIRALRGLRRIAHGVSFRQADCGAADVPTNRLYPLRRR